MKRNLFLLLVIICYIGSNKSAAQTFPCQPNTDTTTFISPDTLSKVIAGVPYNQVIYFRAPIDTLIPFGDTVLTVYLDTIHIDSISGFPAGFTYGCNPLRCDFIGGTNGCLVISGIAEDSEVGIHPLIVHLSIDISDSIGKPPFGSIVYDVDYFFLDVALATGVIPLPDKQFTIADPFPNPASNSLYVIFKSFKDETLSWNITDNLGRKTLEGKRSESANEHALSFNITTLPAGQYFLQINNGQTSITKTFFRQ